MVGVRVAVIAVLTAGRGREAFDPEENVAFVTSTAYSPMMFGTDLAGADAICAAHAANGGLPGTFVAHVTRTTVAATDRLGTARGWLRMDGLPLADRAVDIAAGRLWYPLRLDELGNDVGVDAPVSNGVRDGYYEGDCEDYTDETKRFRVAHADAVGRGWVEGGLQPCTMGTHVACFGVGYDTVIAPPEPVSGRYAFVTVQSFGSTGGIAEADALCNQEAQLAGLSGNYLALLSTSTQTAASRFDLTGPPWVRVDGLQLARSPLAFMAEELVVPLHLTALGSVHDTRVVTGVSPGSFTDGVCADWTSPMGFPRTGESFRTGPRAFVAPGSTSCTGPVYCLQQ